MGVEGRGTNMTNWLSLADLSGSRRALLPASPLGTVRASLPAHGSSLEHRKSMSLVDLAMAMRV